MEKAKKKSILSEKQKKIVNAVVIALELIIVVVAIGFSISILLSTGYETTTDFGDASVRLMPVLTDSMTGDNPDSFNPGDLIIVKKATDESIAALEVGDIVTYVGNVGGARGFITHRIVAIEGEGNGRIFTVKGDKYPEGTNLETKYVGDIKGIYSSKIAGIGDALLWLQEPTQFFLVVMLPLILLLVYNAYLVIRMVVEAKLKKQQEQAEAALAAAQSNAALDEEEIKRRAIEEYLASQNAGAQAAPEQPEAEQKEDGKKEPPQE